MKALYALFDTPDGALVAMERVSEAGIPDQRVTVIASRPLEDPAFSRADRLTRLWWMAAAGGVAGFITGTLLTSLSQLSWPLNTGGMPIVSIWANIVPVFELTMLGAVVSSVLAFLVGARLGRALPALYDPEVSNGKILVGVEDPPGDAFEPLTRALAGGEIKRID